MATDGTPPRSPTGRSLPTAFSAAHLFVDARGGRISIEPAADTSTAGSLLPPVPGPEAVVS